MSPATTDVITGGLGASSSFSATKGRVAGAEVGSSPTRGIAKAGPLLLMAHGLPGSKARGRLPGAGQGRCPKCMPGEDKGAVCFLSLF